MIVNGIRELARELALSVGKVHAHLKSGKLPPRGPDGYDVDAARAALDARADETAAAIEAMAPAGKARFDPREIAEESVARAREFSSAAHGHEIPRALETVKKALEEHRRTERGELELALKKGEAIPVADASATIGRVAKTFVSSLDRVEAKLASQLELWIFDNDFRALEPRSRRRAVQEWFAVQTEILRRLTAAEIDRMIVEERSE